MNEIRRSIVSNRLQFSSPPRLSRPSPFQVDDEETFPGPSNFPVNNLFKDLPNSIPEELVDVLTQSSNVRIERIVSTGHATADGDWYDQDQHEWVVVLKGEARLLFQGDSRPRAMNVGDHVLIPAHRKHRVHWTTPDEPTVWLAVFFNADA